MVQERGDHRACLGDLLLVAAGQGHVVPGGAHRSRFFDDVGNPQGAGASVQAPL